MKFFRPKEKKPLSEEEIRKKRLAAAKAEIEKEYKKKLMIEKYRSKVLKYIRFSAIGILILIVLIFGIVLVRKLIAEPEPEPAPVEKERPSEGFAIKVEESGFIKSGQGFVDLWARLSNSDQAWGVNKLDFKFILQNEQGENLREESGQTYILPNQRRYLVIPFVPVTGEVKKVDLELDLKEVQKLKQTIDLKIASQDINWEVYDQKSKVSANLVNNSPYGFGKVDIYVILFDEKDEVRGVNYTYLSDFSAGSKRYFSCFWKDQFKDKPPKILIEPYVNVFEQGAFMEVYGEGQKLEY